jgi:hypothetical protein
MADSEKSNFIAELIGISCLLLLFTSMIYFRGVYYVKLADTNLISVFIWQLSSWFPWYVVILVRNYYQPALLFRLFAHRRLLIHVVIATIWSLLMVGWFMQVSQQISPFLETEDTRYGVFKWFFINWFIINGFIYLIFLVNSLNKSVLHLTEELSDTYLEHFFVRSGKVSDLIKIENIDWIEAQDYYVKIHTSDKHYLVRTSLADFEKQLPPSKFVRIHRSYLVNLDSLTSIKQKEQGKYEAVVNNVSLEISRSGLSRLKQEAQVFS